MAEQSVTADQLGYLTSAQAARLLGVRAHYVLRLVAMGKLSSKLIVGRRLFSRADIEEYKLRHPRVGKNLN